MINMKKSTILFISIFFVLYNLNGQIPSDSLIGFWPFNGNAIDESGNGNDGTVNGATLTADRFGNLNSAYSFNGIDNNIAISDFANIFPTTSVSISVWAWGNSAKQQALFANGGGSPYNRVLCHLYYNTPSETYWDFGDITNGGRLHCNINSAQLNLWEHYVFIADSSSNLLQIYRNGVLECSTNTAIPHFYNINEDFFFGGGTTAYFDGKIDDIRIYNRVLTQNEIDALFNENLCNIDTTLSLNDNTLMANQSGATYQWLDCNNNFAEIAGATNQTFTATQNGSYAVEITLNNCI